MDKQTIETYNNFAKEYDEETTNFWLRFPGSFLKKFIELTKGKVLDIGSGPGRDAIILKQNGFEVVCLDSSEAMLKFCSEKGLTITLGDFNNLPFPDESFDGVWSYTSLLHVPKSEINKPLWEIKRVLKPGGIFGFGTIEGETEGYIESPEMGNQPRWFSFYKKEEIENLLKQFGFEVVYFEKFQPRTKNYLNFISKKLDS